MDLKDRPTDSANYLDWSKAQVAAFPNLKPFTKTISLRLPPPEACFSFGAAHRQVMGCRACESDDTRQITVAKSGERGSAHPGTNDALRAFHQLIIEDGTVPPP
jgi:CopG antitoxin of type II toxin-antitoxin system